MSDIFSLRVSRFNGKSRGLVPGFHPPKGLRKREESFLSLLDLAPLILATYFLGNPIFVHAAGTDSQFSHVPGMDELATDASTSAAPNNALGSVSETETNLLLTTNSMDTLDEKHKLAIGDRLSFRIIEDEEDPKGLSVTDSGDLEMPYIGRFPALGKTCKQLARELKTELEKEYYYQATVIVAVDVMTKNRGKVYLVGPVRAPGPQEMPSDEKLTLSRAILRAGGFTDLADKRNVKVTRKGPKGGDQKFTVNVGEILEKGKTDSDLILESDDLIYVPERLIHF